MSYLKRHMPQSSISNNPLVSCVTPITKDREKYLGWLYRSFLNQTYDNTELLIGSEDKIEFLPHPRIRFIETPGSISLGAKRNVINTSANGDFIAHFDSDEYSAPDRISKTLSQPPGKLYGFKNIILWDVESHVAFEYIGKMCKWISGSSMIYERKHWCYNQFQEVSIQEDTKFFLQTSESDVSQGVNEYTIISAVHESNTFRYVHGDKKFSDVSNEVRQKITSLMLPVAKTVRIHSKTDASDEKRRLELMGYQCYFNDVITHFDYHLYIHGPVLPWSGLELINAATTHPYREIGLDLNRPYNGQRIKNVRFGRSLYKLVTPSNHIPKSVVAVI